ncbi:hypothetical protein COI07_03115 [Neisseria meningitidis]|nr:hypothetical protein COI07_03115 [Neisseria meningitidis]
MVFCFCRNDEILSFRNLSGATETALPSFPRRRESRTWNLKKPFYPISFRADKFGFPLVRE